MRLLLDKDAAIEAADCDGRPALSRTAERGREAVVRLLLYKGAVTETADNIDGRTLLSWATEDGPEAVVRLPLDKGVAAEAPDSDRRMPLSRASLYRH